jgi:hypothetical protein
LKAVKNPKHKEHQQMLEWLDGNFDPGHFDLQKINAKLRSIGTSVRITLGQRDHPMATAGN